MSSRMSDTSKLPKDQTDKSKSNDNSSSSRSKNNGLLSNSSTPDTSTSASSKSIQVKEEEYIGQDDLRKIANLIKSGQSKNVILLLGAGISTSAGIPDFRSPDTGLYNNLQKLNLPFPEAVFELGFFKKRPEPFWTLAKEIYPGKHYPTPTHYFLPLLHSHQVLKRVFTQNIDTLETLAGLPEDLIIEAHGSFAKSHCLECKRLVDRDEVLKAGVRMGEVVRCDAKLEGKGKRGKICGGLVKPDIVFFGENLPQRFFEFLPDLKTCDLLIVIGTSLQVQPFASLVDRVPSNCKRLLINREPVGPFSRSSTRSNKKDGRDIYWEGDADEGITRLVRELGWVDEFDEIRREGKKRLDKRYKDSERLEDTPRKKGKDGEKVVGEKKDKEENGVEEEGELENALKDKLKL